MAKNQMDKLLLMPDKGIGKTSGNSGVIARHFRRILVDRNITIPRWGSYMYDFLTDIRHGIPMNRKDQTSMRGNLTKEFSRDQMTFKVFLKAMRFFKVVKIDLVTKLYFEDSKPSVHMTTINLGGHEISNQEFLEKLDRDIPDDIDEQTEDNVYDFVTFSDEDDD